MRIVFNEKSIKIIGLTIFSLVLIFFTVQPVYAGNNLELVGTDVGLVVTPQDENLFNEFNMNPGDSLSGKLVIRNSYVDGFDLYLRTERVSEKPGEGEADLYDQLMMTVTFRGRTIFDGPMKYFAEEAIELGSFEPGDMEEIVVQVSLPGATTGNTFQASSLENKWILTAQTNTVIIDDEDPPLGPIIDIEDEEVPIGPAKLPKTGSSPKAYFYFGGALLIASGVLIKRKQRNTQN